MSDSGIPSYVPSQYRSWVSKASAGTGLSPAIVAAQINEESGFNPSATSPTGAEGIAQFEPGTYADAGGKGSEYNPNNELQPYITLTNQDLNWSGGNVEKALAAYNAGQGNWQAGIGYAETILGNAGQANGLTVTPNNVNTSPSSPTDNTPAPTFKWYDPATWNASIGDIAERVGLVIFGALLIIVGVWMLAGKQSIKLALTTLAPEAKAASKASKAA